MQRTTRQTLEEASPCGVQGFISNQETQMATPSWQPHRVEPSLLSKNMGEVWF